MDIYQKPVEFLRSLEEVPWRKISISEATRALTPSRKESSVDDTKEYLHEKDLQPVIKKINIDGYDEVSGFVLDAALARAFDAVEFREDVAPIRTAAVMMAEDSGGNKTLSLVAAKKIDLKKLSKKIEVEFPAVRKVVTMGWSFDGEEGCFVKTIRADSLYKIGEMLDALHFSRYRIKEEPHDIYVVQKGKDGLWQAKVFQKNAETMLGGLGCDVKKIMKAAQRSL